MIRTIKAELDTMRKNIASERGEALGDSFMIVIAIFIGVVLMIVFPIMTVADRTDDVAQLAVQAATSDFAEKVRTTGKIAEADYGKLVETLTSTGNTYDVNMVVQVKDVNLGKKTSMTQMDKTGENAYYSVYKTQIEEAQKKDPKLTYYCNEGDIFTITVNNTSQTLGEQLKNFIYKVMGNDAYSIAAQHTVVVVVNGK